MKEIFRYPYVCNKDRIAKNLSLVVLTHRAEIVAFTDIKLKLFSVQQKSPLLLKTEVDRQYDANVVQTKI